MASSYPIIALWAHPRSMSTALERVMRERGDMRVFHEPFMADYYTHRAARVFPMLQTGGESWVGYEDMRRRILDAGQRQPVFFKDMAFYVLGRLRSDPDFARRLVHVFLIRDPRLSIASYWKKDADATLEEIGLEAQWQLAKWLSAQGLDVYVLEADAVAADPRGEIGDLWKHAGLRYIAGAFSWQSNKIPDGWEHVAGWHQEVIATTGLQQDTRDPDVVFAEVADQAPRLSQALSHHWVYYQMLKERRFE